VQLVIDVKDLVIDVEDEEVQPPPPDHYVRRKFVRNLIIDSTLVVSLL